MKLKVGQVDDYEKDLQNWRNSQGMNNFDKDRKLNNKKEIQNDEYKQQEIHANHFKPQIDHDRRVRSKIN